MLPCFKEEVHTSINTGLAAIRQSLLQLPDTPARQNALTQAQELQSLALALASLDEDRHRLLNALPPCPIHGPHCVPYAVSWLNHTRALVGDEIPPLPAR